MELIVEAFFSGCISKLINDGKDYSWVKIKRIINDKNDQNISTKIYRVIERTLNIVTVKKFKDTDKLYDAIEKIFIEFKNHGDTLESVKYGLDILGIDVSNQRCENFLEKFYAGIRQDDDLYKAVSMTLQQNGIKIRQEEFQKFNEKIDKNHAELIQKIASINENLNRSSLGYEDNITTKKLKFQNNKKQDYIKNWNSRLFLHFDNDEKPITLADAFIMPDYIVHKFIKKIFSTKSIALDKVIEHFIEYDSSSTLLITGVPGIGKSSITSWIAQKYEADDNCIILRFRDWEREELEEGVFKAICDMLECKKRDLNGKVIILDGFDEIKCLDRRDYLLYGFLNDINDLEKLKIIITSRLSYINWENFYNVIELSPFGIYKIIKFCNLITGVELSEKMIDTNNLDVLGIPVILYMAIMSNINLNDNATKPELYNRIFAEKGGLFDRFYDGITEYGKGTQILRNPQNIKSYLEFLRDIAFKMFYKNSLTLMKEEYQIPKLAFQGNFVSILEFPIKYLFENIKNNIEFVHQSIYEYFIADYIFSVINNELENVEKIGLAACLGNMLKYKRLSKEICEFLKYKISKSELKNKFDIISGTFQSMLRDGMLYHVIGDNKNIVKYEMNVFANMLEIIHLWEFDILVVKCELINDYLRYTHDKPIDLSKFYFEGKELIGLSLVQANLRNINFANIRAVNADLRGADLTDANLYEANLYSANLKMAILSGAILYEANLQESNLQNADLIGADLREAYLCKANLRDALLVDAKLADTDMTDAVISQSQVDYP